MIYWRLLLNCNKIDVVMSLNTFTNTKRIWNNFKKLKPNCSSIWHDPVLFCGLFLKMVINKRLEWEIDFEPALEGTKEWVYVCRLWCSWKLFYFTFPTFVLMIWWRIGCSEIYSECLKRGEKILYLCQTVTQHFNLHLLIAIQISKK